ncbi:MAG TPA: hypothetical protein VLX67_08340 [Stellaceae bacterium]|nr:hypothetical protein [Stellaceae bacterium]
MKPLLPALLASLLLLPVSARADDAPQGPGCGLASSAFISQDQGQVVINCVGVTEELGGQLAGVLTYVLQHRLDPQIVIAKLDEIEGAPAAGAPRTLSADQAQALVQGLVGKPSAAIAVVANPDGKDAGDYALAIATKLQIAGWQIEGRQIRRTAPPNLADITGIALVVHDEKSPPEAALQLKRAMAAAKIFLPIISDPSLGKDAELLWIGKRPDFDAKD